MVGPVLIAFGNEAQKRRYLPRILACEDWWCQGYSEPGAGSDLAALRLRADKRGDRYVLNGQKAWTTLAQYADMMFCLVRTDASGRKQEGISFLLVDMKTPGLTVRPVMLQHGEPDVNEVFFEDVEVPLENLVGEEGRGWKYAKYLLDQERTNIAGVGRAKRDLEDLKKLAARQLLRGRPLAEDPLFAAEVARVEIELMALDVTALRVASLGSRSSASQASMLKIVGSEVQQGLAELMMKAAGPLAVPFDEPFLDGRCAHSAAGPDEIAGLTAAYLQRRAMSIYGGSNEVQRGVIARVGLGL
jgi:alkylation response protein AidB-like acyl-CoA dehydrogenase